MTDSRSRLRRHELWPATGSPHRKLVVATMIRESRTLTFGRIG
jgi:hypothetical protein